jgi:ABC-type uncharacterized transport system substrate-binding protein
VFFFGCIYIFLYGIIEIVVFTIVKMQMTNESKIMLLARILRASGQTWNQIKDRIHLADNQIDTLKNTLAVEDKQHVNEGGIETAYVDYDQILRKCLRELEDLLRSINDPAIQLAIIKEKMLIAEKLISKGHEINIWQSDTPQLTMEATKRISASGEDLVERIMQRLSDTSEPTRILESGIDESGIPGTIDGIIDG